ncbi:MAG: Glu/Leu/Phe/Val dehydrogenase [Rhodospirillales bacterium]|nr:Glu/Leu/Phe/Val dehydrogenase [Rhodospirillales bacterium]
MTSEPTVKIQENPIKASEISAEHHPQYMGHEKIFKIEAPEAQFTAFIGIHSTVLGPALGGIRFKYYEDENAALTDVLRLSEAMTWKNAAGGLNHGGGKSVIMASGPDMRKPDENILHLFALGLNIINAPTPVYFGAEDMNMNEESMNIILETSPWIKGGSATGPDIVGGTPSPLTALGVFECMKVAARHKLGSDNLEGLRVSMQGLGNVGGALAEYLHEQGAILTGCDIADQAFDLLKAKGVQVTRVSLEDIYDVPADIFAPNAIGGTLTDDNIQRLNTAGVKIICGAANNQQQDQSGGSQSRLLRNLGVLYCPDYIVNAGGVIWVAKVGENAHTVTDEIRTGVPARFEEILNMHEQNPDQDMAALASLYARKRVEAATK